MAKRLGRLFCKHDWGVPIRGKKTCLKCGSEREVPALLFNPETDRARIEAARKKLEELKEELPPEKAKIIRAAMGWRS